MYTKQNLQARDQDHVANIDDILPCIHWATCNVDRQDCPTRFCASHSACMSCQRAERETSRTFFEIPHFTPFYAVIIFRMISLNSMLRFQTYDLYLRVSRSPLAARQRALKSEILTTKSELLKTSAQDQFAKWAKLRRSVDKGLADLEKLSASPLFILAIPPLTFPSFSHLISLDPVFLVAPVDAEVASSKSGFSMKFNSLLWLLTTGMQFAVGWWYRKQPVFYLPEGWFGPLNWWLSFPFAPAGMSSFLFVLCFLRFFGSVFCVFCSCFSNIS